MSGCVGDLSTCIYDPEYLLTDVMLRTCDVNYDFSYSENGFWEAKEDISSECRSIKIIARTNNEIPVYAENYRVGTEQSASSFEVRKKNNVTNIDSIFTTMGEKGETCPQQLDRHRSRKTAMEKRLAEE